MTAELNPFGRESGHYATLGSAFSVTLGKMLDGGREGDESASLLPYVRAANIQDHGLDLAEANSMPFTPAEAEALDLRNGDILVVEGGAVGTAVVLNQDMPGWSFQKTVNRLRSTVGWDPRYVCYVLRAYREAGVIDVVCNKSTIPHLTAEKLRALRVPYWEPRRQCAIADYLDRETARIDTLISEQQRLIEMLVERRRGLISHVVLEATGERIPLRRVVDVIDCAHVTAEFVDDDTRFPVASIQECQGSTVDLSRCKYTTEDFFNHLRSGGRAPRVGDLLFIRNVSVGLVAAVAPGTPPFAVGQETVLLRRKTDVESGFLRYALVGAEAQHAIEGAMIGSTFRRINVSAIRALPVPMVPIDRQRAITAYLDEQIAKIDALIAEAERFIELARERRSALITAAVTGQIDVRESVA